MPPSVLFIDKAVAVDKVFVAGVVRRVDVDALDAACEPQLERA